MILRVTTTQLQLLSDYYCWKEYADRDEIKDLLENKNTYEDNLSSQIAELKNIQWEHPAEFQALPSQVSSVQEKLKTLDSLPSLLNKITDTLNRFATVVENTLGATTKGVPLA
ncbi:hypothetical protein Tco_0771435, partial [Tanacetum coccineum]